MARKTSRNSQSERLLRAACWAVVWIAGYVAPSQPTAPGGMGLGIILAGPLAIYLRATRKGVPNSKGRK